MIRFRPLGRDDLPTVSRWLGAPHVARWWADDPSPAAVEVRYGPSVDGTDPAEVFIAVEDGDDLGLIQRYAYADEPAYSEEMGAIVAVRPGDWSIDYLIGDVGRTGRGLGRRMIRAFVAQLFDDHPSAHRVVVAVHEENPASWTALLRAGFRIAARGELEPDNPSDSRRHLVLTVTRG